MSDFSMNYSDDEDKTSNGGLNGWLMFVFISLFSNFISFKFQDCSKATTQPLVQTAITQQIVMDKW